MGVPPSTGSSILATMGSTRNIRNALRNSVEAKSGSVMAADRRSDRVPRATPAETLSEITPSEASSDIPVGDTVFACRLKSGGVTERQNRACDYRFKQRATLMAGLASELHAV